jgi:hypothetical protein
VPRTYIVHLQNRAKKLEEQLKLTEETFQGPLDAETLIRGMNLVKIRDTDTARFLGPSSGIFMTRLVMELIKAVNGKRSIHELVSEAKARRAKEVFAEESGKPSSKIYPLVSDVAAPNLPGRLVTDRMISQYMNSGRSNIPGNARLD